MNHLKTIHESSTSLENTHDYKMFFKNQGRNEFWQQFQEQSLPLKDVWQP